MVSHVDPPRNRQTDQLEARVDWTSRFVLVGEHHAADLDGAHTAFEVERVGHGKRREPRLREVRQQRPRVDVDRVPADRLEDRHAPLPQRCREVARVADPVRQIVQVERLAQADGDAIEVSSRKTAVRRESLHQDQAIPCPLVQHGVVEREQTADVRKPVLLRAHRHPVGQSEHLARDVDRRRIRVAGLPLADEERILRVAASVDEQLEPALVHNSTHVAQIGQGHRLTAAAVVGHRDHHERNAPGSRLVERALELRRDPCSL